MLRCFVGDTLMTLLTFNNSHTKNVCVHLKGSFWLVVRETTLSLTVIVFFSSKKVV